jgi:hypothetical protein
LKAAAKKTQSQKSGALWTKCPGNDMIAPETKVKISFERERKEEEA